MPFEIQSKNSNNITTNTVDKNFIYTIIKEVCSQWFDAEYKATINIKNNTTSSVKTSFEAICELNIQSYNSIVKIVNNIDHNRDNNTILSRFLIVANSIILRIGYTETKRMINDIIRIVYASEKSSGHRIKKTTITNTVSNAPYLILIPILNKIYIDKILNQHLYK